MVVECLLDSSCLFLFQILNMTGQPKLVNYSDTDSEEEVVGTCDQEDKLQAPVTGGQEQNNNSEFEVEMVGPGDPDGKLQASGPGNPELNNNPGLVVCPANYPVWAPPTTLYRSLAREPVRDLTVNGVSCKLQSVMVELGGKAGKVAFLAKNGVVDVTPKRMTLRKKVPVSSS